MHATAHSAAGGPETKALHDALFRPRAVALVGLSSNPKRPAGRPLAYMRGAGFGGAVYVVNPRRDEVQGEKAWASLRDLPEVPERLVVRFECLHESAEILAMLGLA